MQIKTRSAKVKSYEWVETSSLGKYFSLDKLYFYAYS